MTLEELKVVISADTKKFSSQIKSAKNDFRNFTNNTKSDGKTIENSVDRVNSAMTKLKRTIATLGIAKLLKDTFSKSTGIASDLAEVQNVVDVAFGSMSKDVESFAKDAIKSLGMSELSAKQYASTYMAMSNGMGIAADNGKNMALQLTRLTGDMASFYNVEQDVASTALKSVYTGETEALKKFGVVMTEANLKAFALSRGITKNYSDMTQAEKVALRYGFVMQSTANAQGDFARTSGSWANQVRILKEQWAQFMGIIGNGLIKIFTPVLQLLNTVLSRIIDIANAISTAISGKSITTSLGNVSSVVDDVGTGFSTATGAAKELKKTIMGFDELQTLNNSVSGAGGGGIIGGGISGGGIDLSQFNASLEDITVQTDRVKNKIQQAWKDMKAELEENGFKLAPIIEFAVTALKVTLGIPEDEPLLRIQDALLLLEGFSIGTALGGVSTGLLFTLGIGLLLGINRFTANNQTKETTDSIINKMLKTLPIIAGLLTFAKTKSIWAAALVLGLTLYLNNLAINNKGMTAKDFMTKLKDMLNKALVGGIAGGILGFVLGGTTGMLLGMKIGASLTIVLQSLSYEYDKAKLNAEELPWYLQSESNLTYEQGSVKATKERVEKATTVEPKKSGGSGGKYIMVKQAKGGVWTTPTPALLAEYAGATSNPEIVAPQSIIEETINASNGQLASVFTQVGRQIIQAINDKEDSVVIGDETITRAAARGNESFKKRTGYSLI